MYIQGTNNAETLNGTSGDDEMVGLKGDDTINGLGGNDLIYWRTGARAADSDGNDSVDGGDGVDRFLVIASTAEQNHNGYFYNHSYRLEADLGGFVSWKMDSVGTFTIVHGTFTEESHSNVLLKNVEAFSFHGAYGSSTQPDDKIVVGDLRGTDLTGLLLFDLGDGRDELDASAAYNEIVANGGKGDDRLFGGHAHDELLGGAGNDLLSGGGGSNTLIGGTGDDTYQSDNRFDSVIEQAGEGTDTLLTAASYYLLQRNVEDMTFNGVSGDFTGLGNAQDNVIHGGAGNDYLCGLDGNDTLYGHGGVNTLQGGTGNDSYYADTRSDTVYELPGEGIDTVYTLALVYFLPDNIENLQGAQAAIPSVTWFGNDLNNVIIGTSVQDSLYGLGGNDTLDAGFGGNNDGNYLVGGTGDDTYRIQNATDQVVEMAGEGNDTVEVRYINQYTLPENVENLVVFFNNGQRNYWQGNGLDNHMTGGAGSDSMSGGAGADVIDGGAGGDFLFAGDGDDILNGGAGPDEMGGGAGADRFVFADPSQQDMVHDFSHAEGDKVDVSQLLASVGYAGSDPFADGYLRIVPGPASPQFEAYTRLEFDPDGAAGPNTWAHVAIFRGGTDVIAPQDFIFH
jgi:Ca2+-binding RTX toxin-like protein